MKQPINNHNRYFYQIPINAAILITSVILTHLVVRYEQNIGGGISRPLLFLLINVEIFIAIFLAASIIRQSVILFLERRNDRPGSVFKKNLLFSFIFLSILPGIFIFLGASKLVVKHLDLWFGTRVEQGLTGGLALYQEIYKEMRHSLAQTGERIAGSMITLPTEKLSSQAENFELHWWPREVEGDGVDLSIETKNWRTFREFNDRAIAALKESFLSQLAAIPDKQSTLIDFFGSTYWVKQYPSGVLSLIYRPPAGVRSALIKVQNAQADYLSLREMKHVLKFNFYLQAIILLFLVLVLAIWCAFYLARGISEPIQNLLEATNQVRAGNLTTQITPTGSSDLQALSISFNEMTKSLAAAQDELINNTVKLNTLKTWQEAVKQIAHEIKNPLTPIQLTTQRLQRRSLSTLSPEEAVLIQESCTLILEQVSTIKKLVADFSSFAIQSRLDLQPCDTVELTNGVVALFQLSYPNIRFMVETSGAHILLIDTDKMKRVFVNLITNSIEAFKLAKTQQPTITISIVTLAVVAKAMPPTGKLFDVSGVPRDVALLLLGMSGDAFSPELSTALEPKGPSRYCQVEKFTPERSRRVEGFSEALAKARTHPPVIPAAEPGSSLLITLHDNGPGIAASVIDQLFLPYISTSKKNMGLGLAIVHEIITQHGGTICAQPTELGARFDITLPIK